MADITSVVNTILSNGSTEYQSRVPTATRENIAEVANPILSYTPLMNEFINTLMNKVVFKATNKRTFVNPLAALKKGTKPLGFDIENNHVNPAADLGYDRTGSTLLNTVTPDVKTQYHRLNRRGKYKVTVYEDDLRHAFTSWDALGKFIDDIINSLYSGDYIDEYILMKNVFADAIQKQKMITAGITAVTDEATAKAFLTAIKNISNGITFPGTAYNAYAKAGGTGNPVTTWTPKENQLLIVRSDIMNYLDVMVLSALFNMSKAEFTGRIIMVDNFGSMSSVNAILADEAILEVWDDKNQLVPFYNGEGLYTNYIWHHWQTYSLSLLANAVAFVDDSTAPNAPVITAPAADATEISGTGEAGATVFITCAGETRTALVAVGGAWTCTGYTALVQGASVTGYQVDKAGNKSAAATPATVTA